MAAFNENNLNDFNENLRNTSHGETGRPDDNLVRGTGNNTYSFIKADNPAGSIEQSLRPESDNNREVYKEGSGIWNSWSLSDSTQPGPGDDDDDDDLDDDDLLDDDDDDTLIPIEGDDDDDSLLDTEDDDDIIPGTDMDDGDDLLDDDDDDDDFDVDDSGVNRSTTGDLGANISKRDDGRSTGRMIDHEPGTSGI